MTKEHAPPTRWRPWQFRLQSCFFCAVVIGLTLGWMLDRRSLSEELDALKSRSDYEQQVRARAELDAEILRDQLNRIYSRVDEATKREMELNWRRRSPATGSGARKTPSSLPGR